MSGELARRGFRYQDLFILRRVLDEAAIQLNGDAKKRAAIRFGIEARTEFSPEGSPPAWDAFFLFAGEREVVEVKSGDISRDDRHAFWKRLRRELHATPHDKVIPTLVVDPSSGANVTTWAQLVQTASNISNAATHILATCPSRVTDPNELLDEALWFLCGVTSEPDGIPVVNVSHALQALACFRLELHVFSELEESVLDRIELLFPDGLSDQLCDLILGWLNRRAAEPHAERHFFTLNELLGEMGVAEHSVTLDPGTLERWRSLWAELPALLQARSRMRLGEHGEAIEASRIQPEIAKSTFQRSDGGQVLVGKAGGGKTTLLAQIQNQWSQNGVDIFACGADDVAANVIEDLFRSLRFRRASLAAREQPMQFGIAIDGLDEAEPGLRKLWVQQIARFATKSKVTATVTVREAVWRTDGITQVHLNHWAVFDVHDWPEALVRQLVETALPGTVFTSGLISLLRQPLMLDLFWRTFVEASPAIHGRLVGLQTRHQLLSAFWQERLVRSPRHQTVNLSERLDAVIAQAAASVGYFINIGGDAPGINVFLSESVVISEGKLHARYRFRHPLLRDFAIGLWCLNGTDAAEVAKRWSHVNGTLQRHGALRAIFEALADESFAVEYAHVTREDVVAALLSSASHASTHLAQLLGSMAPEPALDPAAWPLRIQAMLPPTFGRELVTSARFAESAGWTTTIANWPMAAAWLDEDFATELWHFTEALANSAKVTSKGSVLALAKVAAAKLRQISEDPKFQNVFQQSERWLKMQVMITVIPLLPDEATLAWVEREMPQSTWRTRGWVLQQLVNLAPANAARSADIYRSAVGLHLENGRPAIDVRSWVGTMDHQAIEWSLAGEDGHRGLLNEHPDTFLPVAFELLEALMRRSATEAESRSLINDHLSWHYDREYPSQEPSARCIKAIRACAGKKLERDPSQFLHSVAPLFKTTNSLTLVSVYFDLLLKHLDKPDFQEEIIALLRDGRLYHCHELFHWIEQALSKLWSQLVPTDRDLVLANIHAIVESPHLNGAYCRGRLLAILPQGDLSPEDRAYASEHLQDFEFTPHPAQRSRVSAGFVPHDYPGEDEARAKGWPATFPPDRLIALSSASRGLFGSEAKDDDVRKFLPLATSAAMSLLPLFEAHPEEVLVQERSWVWRALEDILEKHRRTIDGVHNDPPAELVGGCTRLSLIVLEQQAFGFGGEPEVSDTWHHPETAWSRALDLADAALCFPPVESDAELQTRFERVLEAAFASGEPAVQLAVITSVRDWHWFRNDSRRSLHDKLMWQTPRRSSVLSWALGHVRYEKDPRRAEIYRSLLNRGDVDHSAEFADRLGPFIGGEAMIVYDDGKRSSVASLLREVIDSPEKFPFLSAPETRIAFFRSIAFGLKNFAKDLWIYTELAEDFGRWNLQIWRLLLPLRHKRQESEGVILFALYWLEPKEGPERDVTKLRIWWSHLVALCRAVVHEGGRPDCFTLFFNLRDGELNHVLRVEELFEFVHILIARLVAALQRGELDLDAIDREHDEYSPWREILRHASEALDTLRRDGLLRSELQREKAGELLGRLATAPFNIESAVAALQRLRNESI